MIEYDHVCLAFFFLTFSSISDPEDIQPMGPSKCDIHTHTWFLSNSIIGHILMDDVKIPNIISTALETSSIIEKQAL